MVTVRIQLIEVSLTELILLARVALGGIQQLAVRITDETSVLLFLHEEIGPQTKPTLIYVCNKILAACLCLQDELAPQLRCQVLRHIGLEHRLHAKKKRRRTVATSAGQG